MQSVGRIPRDGLACFQFPAGFGKPESGGNGGINEGLENRRHRLPDHHLAFDCC